MDDGQQIDLLRKQVEATEHSVASNVWADERPFTFFIAYYMWVRDSLPKDNLPNPNLPNMKDNLPNVEDNLPIFFGKLSL